MQHKLFPAFTFVPIQQLVLLRLINGFVAIDFFQVIAVLQTCEIHALFVPFLIEEVN